MKRLSIAGVLLGIAFSFLMILVVGVTESTKNLPRLLIMTTSIVGYSVAALVGFFGLLPIIARRCVATIISCTSHEEMIGWITTMAGCALCLALLANSDVVTHGLQRGLPIVTIVIFFLGIVSPAVLVWAARGHLKTQAFLLFLLSIIVYVDSTYYSAVPL